MNSQSATWKPGEWLRAGGDLVELRGRPSAEAGGPAGAVRFDGRDDAIVVRSNPLAGAGAFMIEVRFRPEAGGPEEQRFLHVQGDDESRALLELRSTPDGWYGDVFVHFASGERFLNDPAKLHPFGRWYRMALVYTGSELRQYVDGGLELRGAAPAGTLGDGAVSIGMRLNGISPFKGAISQIRFRSGQASP